MAQNCTKNPQFSEHKQTQTHKVLTDKAIQQKIEIYAQADPIPFQNQPQQESQSPIEEYELQIFKNQPEISQNCSPIRDYQNSFQNSNRIQTPNKNNSLNPSSNDKIPSCHCKKSKCLKMYCDCFAKGNKCRETCKCIGCENTKFLNRQKKPDIQNDEEIEKSQDSNKKSLKLKERSCNCKKSFCLKKYCECYNANIPCSQVCKCEDCKNNGENNGFRDDKISGNLPQIDPNFFNPVTSKPPEQFFSQPNTGNDKKQEIPSKKRQKPDEDEIQIKISQILQLVPQQNYQTMLDFLAYCLS